MLGSKYDGGGITLRIASAENMVSTQSSVVGHGIFLIISSMIYLYYQIKYTKNNIRFKLGIFTNEGQVT